MLVLCATQALAQTTVPPPPSQLTATGGQSGGNRTIILGWAGNGDTPASAYPFQYNIYRGTTLGGEAATPIATLSSAYTHYSDANLSNGTTYYYTVTASNTQGESAPTNEASATSQSEAVIGQGAPSAFLTGVNTYSAAMDITNTGDLTAQSVSISAVVLIYSTSTGTVYQDSQSPVYPVSLGGLAPGASFHLTGVYSNVADAVLRKVLVQGSYTSNGQSVPFSFKPDLPSPTAPADLAAYATGSGKVTLYWSGVPSATGYNVYRGTAAGGEDYAHPVNGSTPVTTQDTGPGVTNMFLFSDTGLTDGTEYFYTVEAVSGSAQSGPSNEDSETSTADAIPWDGTPTDILNKVRQSETNLPGLPYSLSYALLRVMGPDGVIYQDGVANSLPADGSLDPTSGTMSLDGNVTATHFTSAVAPVTTSSGSSGLSGPAAIAAKAVYGGGMRRVASTIGVNGSPFTGVAGTYYLPSTADRSYFYLAPNSHEGPNAYIGMTSDTQGKSQGLEIDAGVKFDRQGTYNNQQYPNRWNAFMRIADGTPRGDGYLQNNQLRVMGSQATYIYADSQIGNDAQMSLSINPLPGHHTARFVVFGADIGGLYTAQWYVAAASNIKINAGLINLRMKREVSIDQNIPAGAQYTAFSNALPASTPGGPRLTTMGFIATGSYMLDIDWQQGSLYSNNQQYDWLGTYTETAPGYTYFSQTNPGSQVVTIFSLNNHSNPTEEAVSIRH